MGIRRDAAERTREAILAAARAEVAEKGGAGLSVRAVAREVGVVSSAVYRHFPHRDALLTAMVVESYQHLAAALSEVPESRPAATWRGLAHRFRAWAKEAPAEFQLVYGTPISGYSAPEDTVPAAASVAAHFLAVVGRRQVGPYVAAGLAAQLRGPAEEADVSPSALAAVLAELSALVGFVGLELAGHLVGTADPADQLYATLVDRQVATLGLVTTGRPGPQA